MTWSELHQRFTERLERRIGDLHSHLDRLSAEQDERTTEHLMREFHSLAGIGGTYGYPEITELALQGESICNITLETRGAPTARDIGALRACVGAIAGVPVSIRSAP